MIPWTWLSCLSVWMLFLIGECIKSRLWMENPSQRKFGCKTLCTSKWGKLQNEFSPIVKLTTLTFKRYSSCSQNNHLANFVCSPCSSWLVRYQIDVKTAFLDGFTNPGKEHLVCKFKRSLYELKQAPGQWYNFFDAFLLSHGLKRSHADHYLYTKRDVDGSPTILVLYVNGMLISGKNRCTLKALKLQLNQSFSWKI